MSRSKLLKYFLYIVAFIILSYFGMLIGLNILSGLTFGTLITDPLMNKLFSVSSYLGFIMSLVIITVMRHYVSKNNTRI